MADVIYSVEVQFLQQGNFNAPAASIGRLNKKTDDWGKSLLGHSRNFVSGFANAIDSIGGFFMDLGGKALAGVGAAMTAGMGAGIKMAFAFNEEMENTTIALGAIANANGLVDNLGGGMRVAGDIIKEMRKDAAMLPGEFKDLEGIMTTIASAGAQMGVGMYSMEKMAAKTMTAAAVLKVPMNVAAREMAMLLEGNARHTMPLFNRLGLGMGVKEFNALAPTKRLEVVQKSLDKLNPAVEHFANSWTGIKTTAIDAIRQGVGAVGGPLFQSVKQMVKDFNGWSNNSKDDLRRWGEVLGNGINNAFLKGVEGIKHWYPIIKQFAQTMYDHIHSAWMRILPFIHSALSGLENFMQDPAAFDKLVDLAKELAELRIALGAMQGGGGLPGLLSLGSALAPVAAEAAVVAAAIAAIGIGIWAALDVITDVTSDFHGAAKAVLKDMDADLASISKDLKTIGWELKPLFHAIGFLFLNIVSGYLSVTQFVISAVEGIISAFGWAKDQIYILFGLQKGLNKDAPEPIIRNLEVMSIKEMNAPAEKEKDRKIPQTTMHVGKVEIHVNSNQDPNRIAKRTVDLIKELAYHPKFAGQTGNPVYTR